MNWNPGNNPQKVTTQVVDITPTLAKQYLLENKDNRKLREKLIKKYASLMKNGEWVLTDQAISFDVNGRLLNGQHRLNAVVLSGVTIKSLVTRNLPGDSFKYMDQGAMRTQSDIHKMSPKASGVISSFNQILWKSDITFTQVDHARTYVLVNKNGEETTIESFIDDRLSERKAKIISSSLSLACIIYWVDKTGEDEFLINFYEDLLKCSKSYELRRSLSSRGLSLLKMIETNVIGSWNRNDLLKKFLTFYNPDKSNVSLIKDATDEECQDLKNWCLKVLGINSRQMME